MTVCEVGFEVSEGIYSVNMIWSNTGNQEFESIRETAERKAARYGYNLDYIEPIPDWKAGENLSKGMPMYMIDKAAELKYDPSFAR